MNNFKNGDTFYYILKCFNFDEPYYYIQSYIYDDKYDKCFEQNKMFHSYDEAYLKLLDLKVMEEK